MDEGKQYRVSAKRADTGKWWTFGSLKKNQWGNFQIGMKMTPELKAFLATKNEGDWINFSLFEDEPREDQQLESAAKPDNLDDEIPF